MNNKLHEVYIKKYISSKDYNIVLKSAYEDFNDMYEQSKNIISRDIDFILFLMTKREFIGLVRQCIIIYNHLNIKKLSFDDKWKIMSKNEIMRTCLEFDRSFHIYLTATLYSYV